MTTTVAESALARAQEILDSPGYRIVQDGQPIDVAEVDVDSLGNFYHVLSMAIIAGDHRDVAEAALGILAADATLVPPEAAELMRRMISASTAVAYDAFKGRVLAVFPDPESPVGVLVRGIVARCDASWDYRRTSLRVAGHLADRACEDLDKLGQEARTLFAEIRPFVQELMGRPGPDRVRAIADGYAVADQRLNELLDAYTQMMLCMLVPDDKVPTPLSPLDAPENQAAMKGLHQRLGTVLSQEPEKFDAVLDALQRAASMLMTVATALDQMEGQLDA